MAKHPAAGMPSEITDNPELVRHFRSVRSRVDVMVCVRRYKATFSGRGLKITLPQSWIDDLAVKAGDTLTVYRDAADRLVIVAEKP